jgi:hypothetical protein
MKHQRLADPIPAIFLGNERASVVERVRIGAAVIERGSPVSGVHDEAVRFHVVMNSPGHDLSPSWRDRSQPIRS